MKVIGLIPARMESKRFPGKILTPIHNKPLIGWVIERAKQANLLNGLAVLTDNTEIVRYVQSINCKAIMTPKECQSGTDRIASAVLNHQIDGDAFINIQGDEPLIEPNLINQIAEQLKKNPIVTAVWKNIDFIDYKNPNIVKAVLNKDHYALYFSRAPIPFYRDETPQYFYQHIGIYGYQKDILLKYHHLAKSDLENWEKLEQLRFLDHNIPIKVILTEYKGIGIDTKEDLEKIIKLMKG